MATKSEMSSLQPLIATCANQLSSWLAVVCLTQPGNRVDWEFDMGALDCEPHIRYLWRHSLPVA
eukprot:3918763-Karenia_brevis.AAC.1